MPACPTCDLLCHPAIITGVVSKSDLVSGLYEGGFKLWECAIDMVQYLQKAYPGETDFNSGAQGQQCSSQEQTYRHNHTTNVEYLVDIHPRPIRKLRVADIGTSNGAQVPIELRFHLIYHGHNITLRLWSWSPWAVLCAGSFTRLLEDIYAVLWVYASFLAPSTSLEYCLIEGGCLCCFSRLE